MERSESQPMAKANQQRVLAFGEATQGQGVNTKPITKDMDASGYLVTQEAQAVESLGSESSQLHQLKSEKASRARKGDVLKLLKEQSYCCALCGSQMTPNNSEIDHKRPAADGGDESIANLQWLCTPCNRAKGTMSNGAFIALCQRVTAHCT